ncbi:MAG: hypothetical protein PHE67_05270 [Campylobacterales bacterium]|nr:hypothetical protein [Campylobacterales bacterium]
MFGLFELIIFSIVYLVFAFGVWLTKALRPVSLLEFAISYLVRYQIIYYFGDISYAIGIGVSGNGIYDYLKDGKTFNAVAIFGGLCAIILGAYVRRRNS